MLDRTSWMQHTAHLGAGRSLRTEHDCGEGRVLKVSNGDAGYSAYCFRCNDNGFIPHPTPSLSERLAALERARNAEVQASSSVSLPEPALHDPTAGGWPLAARVWLYKAGLSNDDIITLGAYFHPPTGRVVLPVLENGIAVYWQARSVTGRGMKYLNPGSAKPGTVARYGTGPVIVLTEDILSAFRVSRVIEAWSILGTNLDTPTVARILDDGRPIVSMLDPDAGGDRGTVKILKRLRALGHPVYAASPPRDPKYLTREETLSCVNSVLPSPLQLSLPSRPAQSLPLPPPATS